MKVKVAEASSGVLDWLVARCLGVVSEYYCTRFGAVENVRKWHPTRNWLQGGPIIERELLDLSASVPSDGIGWYCSANWAGITVWGETPLIAAMRAYVTSKFGDEVEVPEEFLK